MKDFEVNSVQIPPKSTKCETQLIGFLNEDYAGGVYSAFRRFGVELGHFQPQDTQNLDRHREFG
jgi:hypothetical protein